MKWWRLDWGPAHSTLQFTLMPSDYHQAINEYYQINFYQRLKFRSKIYLEEFNELLSNQVKVILIAHYIDLTHLETVQEKRNAIEIREGDWRTLLRTLSHYGGLNKKDERNVTYKRMTFKLNKNSPSNAPKSSSKEQPPHDHVVDSPSPQVTTCSTIWSL